MRKDKLPMFHTPEPFQEIYQKGYNEDIDPETGLPRLPEHYYWKIKRDWSDLLDRSYILILKKRGRLFWVGWTFLSSYESTESIVRSARFVLRELNRKREAQHWPRGLVGKYPPKTLG